MGRATRKLSRLPSILWKNNIPRRRFIVETKKASTRPDPINLVPSLLRPHFVQFDSNSSKNTFFAGPPRRFEARFHTLVEPRQRFRRFRSPTFPLTETRE